MAFGKKVSGFTDTRGFSLTHFQANSLESALPNTSAPLRIKSRYFS